MALSMICCYSCGYTAIVVTFILVIMLYMFFSVYMKFMANLDKVESVSDRVVPALVQQFAPQDGGSGDLMERGQDWVHRASEAADVAEQKTLHKTETIVDNTQHVVKQYY